MLSNISFILGVILLMIAVFLIRWLLQKRQEFQEVDPEMKTIETQFNMSQSRRRIQCGVMLAALAVGIMIESWIDDPRARVILGLAMLLVLGWMVLLAMLDIMQTNLYYHRMTDRYRHEQMRLESQIKDLLRQKAEEADAEPEDDEGTL